MIIPDDDKKEMKKSLKIIYVIALLFLLLIVFSVGYLFRHKLDLKCDKEEVIKTDDNDLSFQSFKEIVLFKNFTEMDVEFENNKIINIKIEENQNENVVYIQNEKLFTFNDTSYLDSVFMVEDYLILPIVDKDLVHFYFFSGDGTLVGNYSTNNNMTFKSYTYENGRIFIEAEEKDLNDICSINFYKDRVVKAKIELLYIEDGNFVFRTIPDKRLLLSDLISSNCK